MFIYSVKSILILFILFFMNEFVEKKRREIGRFSKLLSQKKVVNFKHLLREIDSMYPLLSPRHVLEDSLSFPTVCAMLMDIFFTKNPVIGKLWVLSPSLQSFLCRKCVPASAVPFSFANSCK